MERKDIISQYGERYKKKLWNLTKALNDEGSKGNKITLEDEGITITGNAAANAFAKGYEAERYTNIHLKKEVRQDERERDLKQLHMTSCRETLQCPNYGN